MVVGFGDNCAGMIGDKRMAVESQLEAAIPADPEGHLRQAGLMDRAIAQEPGIGDQTIRQVLHVAAEVGAARLLLSFEEEHEIYRKA